MPEHEDRCVVLDGETAEHTLEEDVDRQALRLAHLRNVREAVEHHE